MTNKRYQVFLSSTYDDLQDERFAVMESLHTMKCFVAGMEYFPAIDKDQFEYIKKIIDDCDYYLVILGGRYGSVPHGEDKSFTEKEYDYAVSQNKPIIALLCKDIDKLESGKCETDELQKERYKIFRKKLTEGRMVNFWRDTSELKAKALAAVYTAIQEFPNVPGWIRGDSVAKDEILEENITLRKKNDELSKMAFSRELKCLEFLKNNFLLSFYKEGTENTVELPHVDIFSALALELNIKSRMKLPMVEEAIIDALIIKYNFNKSEKKLFTIKSDEVLRILILFISLDLIQKADAPTPYFILTEFGKRVLFELLLWES